MTPSQSLTAALGKVISGYNIVKEIKETTRHFTIYLSQDSKELVFGFDSTRNNYEDWKKNFNFASRAMTFGSSHSMAHSGFVDEYASLRNEVMDAIAIYQPKSITIGGFSQGAAHATLCMRDVMYNHKIPTKCYAFASPRVYDDRGSLEFDRALYERDDCYFRRITVYGDPVTDLPPWYLGYRHVGIQKMIGRFAIIDVKVHNGSNYLREVGRSLS